MKKNILTGKILGAVLSALVLFAGCNNTVTVSGNDTNVNTGENNNGKSDEDSKNTSDSTDKEDTSGGTQSSGTAKPAAVSDFKAVKGNGKVFLYWTNPTASTFKSVILYYGTSESSLTTLAAITDGSASYKKTGLTNGTTYYFKAVATFTDDDKTYESSIVSATPTESLSSVEFAAELTIGWNLGNTLDAPTETGWGMPTTTKAMLDAVKAAGFKTIRIPVSWSTHVDSSYNIDSTWMARVKEIVDWAIEDDFYVILNIHHDNYSISDLSNSTTYGFAITDNSTLQTKSKTYIEKVWTQIATEFADYDEKLIFEALNEPRDIGGKFAGNEWYTSNSSVTAIITAYEKVAIDAIRAVSGNEDRFIMVPGYAASGADSSMLALYTMPTDSAEDKLILSTHAYSPYNFAMSDTTDTTFDSSDKSTLDSIFNYLKTNYTNKGIGVVMGEASASDKTNTAERIKWANYYFAKALDAGIPVVLWDNMVTVNNGGDISSGECHGYLNRNTCTWYFPSIIKAMMDTAGVTGYSVPEYVAPTASSIGWDSSKATTITTTSSTLGWGTDYKLEKSYFEAAQEGSILKLTFSASGASIKIINSSWTTYSNGTIVNGSASDGVISASSTELYYVLTASDASAWKSQDIYIAGQNGTVTGAYFQASTN